MYRVLMTIAKLIDAMINLISFIVLIIVGFNLFPLSITHDELLALIALYAVTSIVMLVNNIYGEIKYALTNQVIVTKETQNNE